MENLRLSVELPVFGGFYDSIWDGEVDEYNELENINYQRKDAGLLPVTWDDLEFDYPAYRLETCRKVTSVMEGWLKELGAVESLEFAELVSPKYYNYSTDRIFAFASISAKNIGWIFNYIVDYRDAFDDYLEYRHKSCSGFISFYNHDRGSWLKKMGDFSQLDSVELCTIFGFILKNETDEQNGDYEDSNLYEQVEDNYLSCTNYDELLTVNSCSCGGLLSVEQFHEDYKTEVINQVAMFETVRMVKTFDSWIENVPLHCPKCELSYSVVWNELTERYDVESLSDNDE